MSFDWMEPKRNIAYERASTPKRQAMYWAEVEQRAAMLQRLGYPREQARARLAARLRWDFEDRRSPVSETDLDSILERAFSSPGAAPERRSTGSQGGGR